MRDRSLRGVLLAARASGVIKWDRRPRRLDAPINFRGSGNKSIPGQPHASTKHWRSELKNVGKAPDAGISAFAFRACNEGSHRGTRHRNVRVFGRDDHLFVGGEFGEEACASQLLINTSSDSVLSFSLAQLHSLAALLNELGDQSRPSGLVARSDASAIVAMKVLMEIDEVAPVWIVLKFLEPAIDYRFAEPQSGTVGCSHTSM
jgi:hypothetical protein